MSESQSSYSMREVFIMFILMAAMFVGVGMYFSSDLQETEEDALLEAISKDIAISDEDYTKTLEMLTSIQFSEATSLAKFDVRHMKAEIICTKTIDNDLTQYLIYKNPFKQDEGNFKLSIENIPDNAKEKIQALCTNI